MWKFLNKRWQYLIGGCAAYSLTMSSETFSAYVLFIFVFWSFSKNEYRLALEEGSKLPFYSGLGNSQKDADTFHNWLSVIMLVLFIIGILFHFYKMIFNEGAA